MLISRASWEKHYYYCLCTLWLCFDGVTVKQPAAVHNRLVCDLNNNSKLKTIILPCCADNYYWYVSTKYKQFLDKTSESNFCRNISKQIAS